MMRRVKQHCRPHKRPGRAARIIRQKSAFDRLVADYEEVSTSLAANYGNGAERRTALLARIGMELTNLRAKGIGY